ncbi:acetyl-coenzyme A synthetase, partial [Gammaproteobacteria bacterium]|nr:acetyl-coenzyme A synthetase [Gammaproteobacteria bacterium]
MSSSKRYPVTEQAAAQSHLDKAQYEAMYTQSIENPEEFWAEQAGSLLHWHEPWRHVSGGNFATADS